MSETPPLPQPSLFKTALKHTSGHVVQLCPELHLCNPTGRCLLAVGEGIQFSSVLGGRECKYDIPKVKQRDNVILTYRWLSEGYLNM